MTCPVTPLGYAGRMISQHPAQVVESEWIGFPGGELEGTRPRSLCQACRARMHRLALSRAASVVRASRVTSRTLCFQCYRAELDRVRAMEAAGRFDSASEARFQSALPFEPVNRARLARLGAERAAVMAQARVGAGGFAERRRLAQRAARHALERIALGLETPRADRVETARTLQGVTHAAELQLPESWLPFVVSR